MPTLANSDDATLAERRREREEFVARVREGERLAAADPARYRAGLRRMVALGFGYIVAVALGTLALLVVLVALNVVRHAHVPFQFYLVLVLFLFAVLRSLPVKIERSKHPVVTRAEAPALYREVDAVADRLRAPRPDQIQVDARFNASAAQYPRFGLFGPSRNLLVLGLPILLAFEPDEIRSVIGHELGHFSGAHGRLGVAVYRVEAIWAALYRNLGRSGRGDLVFRPFVRWFSPRFSAMSFAMRRQNEYEADAAAAEATSPAVAGRALKLIAARSAHLSDAFWTPFNRALAQDGVPSPGFLTGMKDSARDQADTESARRVAKESLADITDYDDTHPALSDRLRALGVALELVRLEPLVGPSAAEAFLGDALPSVVRRVEDALRKANEEAWQRRHAAAAKGRQRHDALLKTADEKPLSDREAVELAAFRAEEANDPIRSAALFRQVAETYPQSDRAVCHYAAALLELDDPEGVVLLDGRSRGDAALREFALPRLAAYHARHGENAALERLRSEATEGHDRQNMARAGLRLQLNDDLLPPDLSPTERSGLAEQLCEFPELGRAYALRKRLPGTGEVRDYLFILPRRKLERRDEASRLVNAVAKGVRFRGRTQIYCLQPRKEWRRRLDALPNALLYDRKRPQ